MLCCFNHVECHKQKDKILQFSHRLEVMKALIKHVYYYKQTIQIELYIWTFFFYLWYLQIRNNHSSFTWHFNTLTILSLLARCSPIQVLEECLVMHQLVINKLPYYINFTDCFRMSLIGKWVKFLMLLMKQEFQKTLLYFLHLIMGKLYKCIVFHSVFMLQRLMQIYYSCLFKDLRLCGRLEEAMLDH